MGSRTHRASAIEVHYRASGRRHSSVLLFVSGVCCHGLFPKTKQKNEIKKNGSEYKHRRRLWFLAPPVRYPITIPFLSPFPSLSLSPYNPLPFPSQLPPCSNPLPSTTQYNSVPSMERPGTYVVRIRGGAKTDREGMVVGW